MKMVDIGFSPKDMIKGTLGSAAAVPLSIVGAKGVAQDVSAGPVHDALVAMDPKARESRLGAIAKLAGLGDEVDKVSGGVGKLKDVAGDLKSGDLSQLPLDKLGMGTSAPKDLTGLADSLGGGKLGSMLGTVGAQGPTDPLKALSSGDLQDLIPDGAKSAVVGFAMDPVGVAKSVMADPSSLLENMPKQDGPEMGG